MQCATGHYDMYIETVFDAIQSVGEVAELCFDLLINSIHVFYAENILCFILLKNSKPDI